MGLILPWYQNQQRLYKEWKPQTNLSHEHRSKNPQQNTSKVNPATYKKFIHMTKWNLFQTCKGGSTPTWTLINIIHHTNRLRILRWDYPGFRVGPKSNNDSPYKRKTEGYLRHTETGTSPHENWSKDWSDVVRSQGMPQNTRIWKRQGSIYPRAFRGSVGLL